MKIKNSPSVASKTLVMSIFSALSLLNVAPTQAFSISNLYNTGVNDSGAVLGNSVIDPHYALTSQPAPGGLQAVTTPPGYPIPPWVANSTTSRWIGLNTTSAIGPVGSYTYETTFTLPNLANLATVSINGLWSTDNNGLDILINGISTGQTTTFASFSSLSNFTIGSGFQIGSNTLSFVVNNGATVANPTGLRVEGIQGTYDTTSVPVPEPLTILGSVIALGFGSTLKRKLSQGQKDKKDA